MDMRPFHIDTADSDLTPMLRPGFPDGMTASHCNLILFTYRLDHDYFALGRYRPRL
jgi:hypothetical protein